MAYVKHCELCTDKCPQAERAHEAAVGRMYATKEFIALQKKVESGQLVEVVHCRDCRHWEKQEDSAQGRCSLSGNYPTGAWYCGDGKGRCE